MVDFSLWEGELTVHEPDSFGEKEICMLWHSLGGFVIRVDPRYEIEITDVEGAQHISFKKKPTCLLDGKPVHIELSKEAQADLDKLTKDLELHGITDDIICVDENARQMMIDQLEEQD